MGHSRLRWSRPRLVHVRFSPDSDRQPSKRDSALRATRVVLHRRKQQAISLSNHGEVGRGRGPHLTCESGWLEPYVSPWRSACLLRRSKVASGGSWQAGRLPACRCGLQMPPLQWDRLLRVWQMRLDTSSFPDLRIRPIIPWALAAKRDRMRSPTGRPRNSATLAARAALTQMRVPELFVGGFQPRGDVDCIAVSRVIEKMAATEIADNGRAVIALGVTRIGAHIHPKPMHRPPREPRGPVVRRVLQTAREGHRQRSLSPCHRAQTRYPSYPRRSH